MGCVSSKLFKNDLKQDILINNGGDYVSHVVSLTSSTYGVLNLDNERPFLKDQCVAETKNLAKSPPREEPEVINAWELMEDLEEGIPISNLPKKSPKARVFLRGLADLDSRSPLKFFNQIGSPRKVKKSGGKENREKVNGFGMSDYSPKAKLSKPINLSDNPSKAVSKLSFPAKISPICAKRESFGNNTGFSSRRKSLSPLFDPELVASYERELSEEEEHIKRMVSETPKPRTPKHSRNSDTTLQSFEEKCPPGGENAVVIYTTTLRGIRKTFEDCNVVRSIVESHHIHVLERDVSMDSGFKEELRGLMATKEVKIPSVFIKGRLIGGADEVVKLEEEGKLATLFDGIARATLGGCEGCGGMRFVMCIDCDGSCKVMDVVQKKMVKCGECNENGLIHCPICC